MSKKKHYKTTKNNPNMGLHDRKCKNKAGYCCLKKVFLNENQITTKMCRKQKIYNTDEYTFCKHYIDKELEPERFEKQVRKALALHNTSEEKVNKKRIKTVYETDENGMIEKKEIPICQTIFLQDKFTQVMEKNKYYCAYGSRFMGENLCQKRGCKKGTFGKIEANNCPYLVVM